MLMRGAPMNNPPVDTNQLLSEPSPEWIQGCPPAGFWLEHDIVTTQSISRPAGKSATKGSGRKVVSNGGRPVSRNRKRKAPKEPRRKRISAKHL